MQEDRFAIIMSQYPSAGPRIERLFSSEADGVEAVLDVWEHDHAWSVGSGYEDEDAEFDRNSASTRENARAEAKRILASMHIIHVGDNGARELASVKLAAKPVAFWHRGPARLAATGEIVNVIDWKRPYGIPYATTADGREFHLDQLCEA